MNTTKPSSVSSSMDNLRFLGAIKQNVMQSPSNNVSGEHNYQYNNDEVIMTPKRCVKKMRSSEVIYYDRASYRYGIWINTNYFIILIIIHYYLKVDSLLSSSRFIIFLSRYLYICIFIISIKFIINSIGKVHLLFIRYNLLNKKSLFIYIDIDILWFSWLN